jgi:hypothetical protein
VEDEDDSLVRVQVGHRPDDLVPIKDRPEWIPPIRLGILRVDRDERDPTPAAEPVAADVHQDPIEPGLEPGWVAQGSRRLPGPHQGVLGRVLSLVLVAEEHARQAIGPIELTVREAQEPFSGCAGSGGAQFSLPSFERGRDSG